MFTDYDEPEERPRHALRRRPPGAPRVRADGSASAGLVLVGALAMGALAIGALAIGALAIGRLVIGKVRLRDVEIDNLVVHRATGLS